MTATIHLNNAPIVEALIDFRVKHVPGLDLEKLSVVAKALKRRYPINKEIRHVQAQFRIGGGDGPAQTTTQTVVGQRFESSDARFVLQISLDGFTLSRLNPYDTWESLVAEAKSCWKSYAKVMASTVVTRVAARYINRLEIPLSELGQFEDFLTGGPQVPKNVPQQVSEFLSRVVVHEPETGASMIITQALEPINTANDTVPVIIDIDVSKQAEFELASKEYWKLLEKFRVLKNEAFFGSLTPKALEFFK